jgi:hypothetical protein
MHIALDICVDMGRELPAPFDQSDESIMMLLSNLLDKKPHTG